MLKCPQNVEYSPAVVILNVATPTISVTPGSVDEATAAEDYPLLLHYPYFELYRKQIVKQADLVLALFR